MCLEVRDHAQVVNIVVDILVKEAVVLPVPAIPQTVCILKLYKIATLDRELSPQHQATNHWGLIWLAQQVGTWGQ